MKSWLGKLISVIGISLLTLAAQAQVPSAGERLSNPEYLGSGRLLTIRIVPADRTAKLYVVGKKAAQIEIGKDYQVIEITALNKKQNETLEFRRDGEAYVISNLPKWNEPYDLKVRAETRGQKDEVKVRIDKQP